MPVSVNNIFKFSGYSDRRKYTILTLCLIIFFGFGGYKLWSQHLIDVSEKEAILKEQVASERADKLEERRAKESAVKRFLDYVQKNAVRNDSLAEADRRFRDEIKYKGNE